LPLLKKTVKIEPDQVEKPLRKLRKMLDDFSADPRPEDVHALRTHARRVEAAIAALVPARSKEPRRVLKLLTPVRKAAGKVRDMDVLIEDALTLKNVQRAEGLVRLVEHLGKMRAKNAKRLRDAVYKHRRETGARLKELSKVLKKRLEDEAGTLNGGAAPQLLVTELSQWPQLNRANLHMFRLRIKELRYMLELSNEPNKQWFKRLGDVKDAIGEWHDWVGLLKIAQEVLDTVADARVLKRIEKTTDERFNAALTTANQMRKRIFQPSQNRNGAYKARRRAVEL
jgi:CHAD domain-containing protein